ncbi:imidazolonepropionase [Devosia sp.]|uniref:imidazolonepropionase n=1 Tax=Devosia sp. TaxID=1871048 RepID=UPI002EDE851C
MAPTATTVWRNAALATFDPAREGMGTISRGAIAVRDGRIAFVGNEADLPSDFAAAEQFDCEGRWITPGLIDCHTHLVYAGDRSQEFEMRLEGATYEQIARAGGGILSSVRALRAATEDELVAASRPRLEALAAEGVTTVEIKSGYGLDLANETKALRAARRLGEANGVTVTTSLLAAHAVPPEMHGDRSAYIDLIIDRILPAVVAEGLADAVDGFCEHIAFAPEEISRLFDAARRAGLPVRLHADQLTNSQGAALAASHGALSADHLEYTDAAGAAALARAGTVAVVLPGAFYFLRETQKPPIAEFRRAGVRMAVATDSNPGTSPLTSLLLAANMAATLYGMTVAECLAGITREAARALGMGDVVGTLEPGKWADLAVWDIDRPAELVYRIGFNPLHSRIRRGHL